MRTKSLTRLRTGLAYDKVLKDIDRREIRSGNVEQNWKNYIEIARGLIGVVEVSRMAVAEIATRATILRTGGDRQSLNWKLSASRLTVKAFANEIGVKPNTLWLWIKIKERVFDQLKEKDRAKFKHDDAEKTFKLLGSKRPVDPVKTQELYHGLSSRNSEQRRADSAIIQLMSVRKVFKNSKQLLNDRQIQAAKIAILEILKIIEEGI